MESFHSYVLEDNGFLRYHQGIGSTVRPANEVGGPAIYLRKARCFLLRFQRLFGMVCSTVLYTASLPVQFFRRHCLWS